MISCIVAIDEERGIGKNNNLLCEISEDLKRFKELTSRHTIVMGKKTYESIGRPLPNRENIVLTRKELKETGIILENNLEFLNKYIDSKNEIFVIGGGEIYKQTIKLIKKIYITKIHKKYEADTFFPGYESEFSCKYISEKMYDLENDVYYQYEIWERK